MKYLLDVNSLIALAHTDHEDHGKVAKWFARSTLNSEAFLTCAITELGFARVSVQARLEPDVDSAKRTISKMKESSKVPFHMVSDDIGIDKLPDQIRGYTTITDAHLVLLAKANSARLATLDTGIKDAEFIK